MCSDLKDNRKDFELVMLLLVSTQKRKGMRWHIVGVVMVNGDFYIGSDWKWIPSETKTRGTLRHQIINL